MRHKSALSHNCWDTKTGVKTLSVETAQTGVETVLTEPVIEVDSDSGVNEIQDSVNISNINSEKIMELLDSLKDDIKGIESLIEEMIKE